MPKTLVGTTRRCNLVWIGTEDGAVTLRSVSLDGDTIPSVADGLDRPYKRTSEVIASHTQRPLTTDELDGTLRAFLAAQDAEFKTAEGIV